MKCKFCSKETSNEYEVCDECERTLTAAIKKNRKKMVKTKIANEKRGITSLVCAIISLVQPFGFIVALICGIVAIVFGIAAKNTAGAQLGRVGKTVGIVAVVATITHAIVHVALTAIFAAGVALLVIVLIGLGAKPF